MWWSDALERPKSLVSQMPQSRDPRVVSERLVQTLLPLRPIVVYRQSDFHQLLELLDVHLRELTGESLVLQELTLRSQKHVVQLAIIEIFEKGHELILRCCR